ncbi:Asp-tRNA(Asn)/Glu-tRNA(Gln) amidotransferase subunit GatC [Gammaproteobacteria bacterium]|jgi:aspartyl-tRNA(Asn)/glutamyl-tRNA(Gln) amidotransferase subunit C|nr:Asp-tRNA(Asn)/Glu-tRNA(Gln) amidotransferase subunit GatC [Gammaproteobacteria bacterium]
MSIELGDVENIAHLARLDLTEKEKEEAASSMSNIMNLIDQMQSVNTDDVIPLAHAFDAVQRLREDKVTETDQRDELQKIAPETEQGLFLVPKVIE